MFRKIAIVVCGGLAVLPVLSGCREKATIESVPVESIEVSTPVKAPVEEEAESVHYDAFGIRLVNEERRLYGAVIPEGAIELRTSNQETAFYVEGMVGSQILAFLEKYFPYQKVTWGRKANVFIVSSSIKPEFQGEGIVPDLNKNVVKPENPLYIRIFFDKARNAYIWTYRDPAYLASLDKSDSRSQRYEESPESLKKICDLCDMLKENADEDRIQEREEVCSKCGDGIEIPQDSIVYGKGL